jgi:hypothetical protein
MPAMKCTPPSKRKPPWYAGVARHGVEMYFEPGWMQVCMRTRKLRTLPREAMRSAPSLGLLFGGDWKEGIMFFLPESVEVAELLSDPKENFVLVDVTAVPLDQFTCGRDVFGDRLLGENVFTCREGLLDVSWLDRDGQGDDDGVDVGAREQLGERLAVV